MSRRKRRDFNLFESDEKAAEPTKRLSDRDYLSAVEQPLATTPPRASRNETPVAQPEEKDYTRHTFIIRPADLAALQAIVHQVKRTGHYTYSQKTALGEAIALLKKHVDRTYNG